MKLAVGVGTSTPEDFRRGEDPEPEELLDRFDFLKKWLGEP